MTPYEKSFATSDKAQFWHPTKNEKKPRDVFLNCNSKFWFTCEKCKHDFDSKLASVTSGRWCPYCPSKKLCEDECVACFGKSFATSDKAQFWHPKNDKKPRDVFLSSNSKYWFTCEKCTHDFDSTLYHVTSGRWCPKCKNKTEKMLYEWLLRYANDVLTQKTFDWCVNIETGGNYRFDFYIPTLRLLIELDGRQHFQQVSNWKSPELQRDSDVFKMKKAVENGYSIIHISQEDVYYDRNNWSGKLQPMLRLTDKPHVSYVCDGMIRDWFDAHVGTQKRRLITDFFIGNS